MRTPLTLVSSLLLLATSAWSDESPAAAKESPNSSSTVRDLASFEEWTWPGAVRMPVGVTPEDRLVWCVMDEGALDYGAPAARVVVVVGLDQTPAEAAAALASLKRFIERRGEQPLKLAVIPAADPDRLARRIKGETPPAPRFPPAGPAYHTKDEATAAILWRFLGWFAPDLVIEVIPEGDAGFQQALKDANRPAVEAWPENSLAAAARREPVAGIGAISSLRLPASLLDQLPNGLTPDARRAAGMDANFFDPQRRSAARTAMLSRLERTPLQTAEQLSRHYGKKLPSVVYQPALAVMARLRLSQLRNLPEEREAVAATLAPWLAEGAQPLGDSPNGSRIAGQLVFAAWADETGDSRAVDAVRRAADLAFEADGRPKPAMPTHSEMSDAVFMGGPILTAAARLTGEPRYLDMAERHLRFMQQLCLRDDGLYRHSPLCEAPWGRGNGFPMLGLALCLTDLDRILAADAANEELRAAATRVRHIMLESLRSHAAALVQHQDPTGAWRQVVDHPGAYRELTATCMITFALARGLRSGWIDDSHRPAVERGWRAIQTRIGEDGVLFDVCTGTGKQRTLRDYLDRTAILGPDERGGAMALLAAIEMHELNAAQAAGE